MTKDSFTSYFLLFFSKVPGSNVETLILLLILVIFGLIIGLIYIEWNRRSLLIEIDKYQKKLALSKNNPDEELQSLKTIALHKSFWSFFYKSFNQMFYGENFLKLRQLELEASVKEHIIRSQFLRFIIKLCVFIILVCSFIGFLFLYEPHENMNFLTWIIENINSDNSPNKLQFLKDQEELNKQKEIWLQELSRNRDFFIDWYENDINPIKKYVFVKELDFLRGHLETLAGEFGMIKTMQEGIYLRNNYINLLNEIFLINAFNKYDIYYVSWLAFLTAGSYGHAIIALPILAYGAFSFLEAFI